MDTDMSTYKESSLLLIKDEETGRTIRIPDLSDNIYLYRIVEESILGSSNAHPPDVRIQVAAMSVVIPSLAKIGRLTGISDFCIREWKKQPWWHLAVREARRMKNDELDAEFTEAIHFSMEQVFDRLSNGNVVIDKNGEERRVPISARDLTTNLAILFDKRAILRTNPNDKINNTEATEHLEQVANRLEKLVGRIPEPTVVENAEYKEVPNGEEL